MTQQAQPQQLLLLATTQEFSLPPSLSLSLSLSLSIHARLNQSKLIQTSHSKFPSSYPTGSKFATSLIINGPGAHPASYTMGIGSFPGVKRQRRGVDHPPHLAPRLKKEQSYTSAPPLSLRGLFYGELYLYRYLYSP